MGFTVATKTLSTTVSDRSIDPSRVYRLDEFMKLVGWGRWAMRTARADGLKVIYRGGRGFVRGADFVEFLTQQ